MRRKRNGELREGKKNKIRGQEYVRKRGKIT